MVNPSESVVRGVSKETKKCGTATRNSEDNRWRAPVAWGLACLFVLAVMLVPNMAEAEGEEIFSQRCASCHSLGTDRLVGPGLGGVTDRRDHDWLVEKITAPDQLAAQGDPITEELIEEYGVPMANLGVSTGQAEVIIEYLSGADGADQAPAAAVREDFSSDEVVAGAALFEGSRRFEHGGVSCNACHNVDHDAVFAGGSLAVDLTDYYSRAGAAGVDGMLRGLPFPEMEVAYRDRPLTDEEIELLTAFLEDASVNPSAEPTPYGASFFAAGVVGAVFLIGLFSLLWTGRRRQSVNQKLYDRQIKSR